MALASARREPRQGKTRESGPTRQALKSAQTRARLIEATINCIVKYGYANATTPLIAEQAGLSRGAMLHHFENGSALIKAAISELHEKRLRAFRRAAELTDHRVRTLIDIYWRQVQKPTFIAFQELALAARTNPDLAAILHPMQVEFRKKFNTESVQLFPEWQSDPVSFESAMALSQTVLEGMAVNLLTGALDEAMVDPLLDLLEEKIRAMRPPKIEEPQEA
jgi:AcrR family transcriptional regulator